jgi:hypothetical protein
MIIPVLWRHLRHRVARMLAVARIECLHLIHDRTTLALLVTVPAIQIVLFGSTVNLTRKPSPSPSPGSMLVRAASSSARSRRPGISRSWPMGSWPGPRNGWSLQARRSSPMPGLAGVVVMISMLLLGALTLVR